MSDRLSIEGGSPVRTRPFGTFHEFGDDEIAVLTKVVESGTLDNPWRPAEHFVPDFHREFAARHGGALVHTVPSGTAAMHVCAAAIDPEPGDEVIVSPWSGGGTVIGPLFHNCVPVFADVDDSYNLDPDDVEAKITDRTRAIIATHTFGNPCDMDRLRDIANRHGLFVIEDCGKALFSEYQGRRVGTLGDLAAFSFVGQHLSAGFGGAVLVNTESLWDRALGFARIGDGYRFFGTKYWLTDVVAAVLLTQLNRVDAYVAGKIRGAERIIELLGDIEEITPQSARLGDRHTYSTFCFALDMTRLDCSPSQFCHAVREEGIPLVAPLPEPLYRHPFLADPDCYGRSHFPFDYGRAKPIDYRLVECPYGEALMGRTVGFPMWPNLEEDDILDITRATTKVVRRYNQG